MTVMKHYDLLDQLKAFILNNEKDFTTVAKVVLNWLKEQSFQTVYMVDANHLYKTITDFILGCNNEVYLTSFTSALLKNNFNEIIYSADQINRKYLILYGLFLQKLNYDPHLDKT